MPSYVLNVRDVSRTRVAEVDDFTDLHLTLRHNAVGAWILTLPTDSIAADLLRFGGGLIVLRDGVTLLSGPVRSLERQWSADGDVIVASGPDDLTLLADRWAAPVPAGPPYSAAAYDVRGPDPAETVIKEYVEFNLGPSATAARLVPGLVIATDTGLGATVTGRARFNPLLELVAQLAESGGLGVSLRQEIAVGGFPLQFDCYEPADRTATAVFSAALGTLGAFSYTQASAEANYILAAGGGEGTARTFREAGDSLSIGTYGRIEEFLDRRDTTDTGELDQAITDELAQKAQRTELQLTPIDTAAMAFMTDYQLGDRVTVVVDDVPLADIVRTITVQLSADKGETITPIVGSPALADQFVNILFRRLAETRSRVGSLERR